MNKIEKVLLLKEHGEGARILKGNISSDVLMFRNPEARSPVLQKFGCHTPERTGHSPESSSCLLVESN